MVADILRLMGELKIKSVVISKFRIPFNLLNVYSFKGQPFDKKILEELIEEVDEDSKYIFTRCFNP